MGKRKRDHKAAINRRKAKGSEYEKMKKQAAQERLHEEYSDGAEQMPMPSFIEAVSAIRQDDELIKSEVNQSIGYFCEYAEGIIKDNKYIDYLPKTTVTQIIPLDFYLPLPDKCTYRTAYNSNNELSRIVTITVFSKAMPVRNSSVKASFAVVSICDNSTSSFSKKNNVASFRSISEISIKYVNNIISSIQSLPERHNHYLHPITAQSISDYANFVIFDRSKKKILRRLKIELFQKIKSEIFQARPLQKEEMIQFAELHDKAIFSDDKIFKLIGEFNEAINSRCFGFNNRAILLADSFVEYTLGYLYCELRIASGDNPVIVHIEYSGMKDRSEFWQSFKEVLDYSSVKKLKKDIGFFDWQKYCRSNRDDLTHRFLTKDFNGVESQNALYYAGELVRKLCMIIIGKNAKTHPELSKKLKLLADTTMMTKIMKEDADKKGGKS